MLRRRFEFCQYYLIPCHKPQINPPLPPNNTPGILSALLIFNVAAQTLYFFNAFAVKTGCYRTSDESSVLSIQSNLANTDPKRAKSSEC